MEIKTDTTIGEVVRLNFKAAQLFEKHQIDFCCGGDKTLGKACSDSGVDFSTLNGEIEELLKINDPESKYIDGLGMDQLCDYIVSRHHSYVAENIPFLKQKLQKLCDVHGSHHPELFEINKLFGLVAENLAAHMDKEEQILFPVLRKLAQQLKSGTPDSEEVEKARLSIAELEEEHTAEGERFGEIAKLSNQYTMPPDGCNTFDVTYRTLKEFEQDLHRHIHLESNVLFKKAEAMR
jgi:regulator of cell morphogenesis and NO signaling